MEFVILGIVILVVLVVAIAGFVLPRRRGTALPPAPEQGVPPLGADTEAAETALAIADLREAPVERYPLDPLLERAWSLRSRLNAYDALYVALAVELDCPLITTDDRIPDPRLPARVLHA